MSSVVWPYVGVGTMSADEAFKANAAFTSIRWVRENNEWETLVVAVIELLWAWCCCAGAYEKVCERIEAAKVLWVLGGAAAIHDLLEDAGATDADRDLFRRVQETLWRGRVT